MLRSRASYRGHWNVQIRIGIEESAFRRHLTNSSIDQGGRRLSQVEWNVSGSEKELPRHMASKAALHCCARLIPTRREPSHSHVMPPERQTNHAASPRDLAHGIKRRVHVNPEKLPDRVGYSTLTRCGCTSSLRTYGDILDIYLYIGRC